MATRRNNFCFDSSPLDISAPRPLNGQVVLLRPARGGFDVLLQRRSMKMPVMPGHLASIGGMRDRSDTDSRFTAVRELVEETGLDLRRSQLLLGPTKFDEGAKVDWYVMVVADAYFADKAESLWEVADIRPILRGLPHATPAYCFGHAWMPTASIDYIDPKIPLMGGLTRKIHSAVQVAFDAVPPPTREPAPGNEVEVIEISDEAEC
mmetsp:Transcript_1866/g.2508  ORF Transcript_1866/g.2508 Transcript_1866/m.2508 type:complete len:207 (+) Transcript_1866:63-683(+)|eukprot:CAMPEP_0194752208 /NCGR_PEP_ID=MMETSP0323_2-20130528/6021_1 /TAXON_ID=2866 ORGANISM="Crypthecodinium cohnii, Strain Seligo" /NCGR_SAMPLE_ID=MMETSP0323_2 /ASSEMBLY_ACC=CAM_ASM_000346 /LENGTH=206 /DNA_ID=CAMNT_0039668983 /DNA_START=63 /DNA_END=683 /DNA_ORIENTATION=+